MNMIWFFYFYSFLGFLLEVVYARVMGLSKPDRKCRLLLPICPVYGIGATAIVSLPFALQRNAVVLFFLGAILATGTEYLCGWFYERVWGVKFWEYSALPGNLQGRVCLPFALIWGTLALPLCYVVQPLVVKSVASLPNMLLLPVTMIFLVDFVLTGRLLRRRKNTDALRWYQV